MWPAQGPIISDSVRLPLQDDLCSEEIEEELTNDNTKACFGLNAWTKNDDRGIVEKVCIYSGSHGEMGPGHRCQG